MMSNGTGNLTSATDYAFVFDFEKNFDVERVKRWIEVSHSHSLTLSAVYVASIYLGREAMKYRKPMNLKWTLFAWNLFLTVVSVCGSLRVVAELARTLTNHGFHHSICNIDTSQANSVLIFWFFVCYVSKLFELGDTVFIVLRKRPLIFLHWFHHASVLVYTWHIFARSTAFGRWLMAMNYAVHSVMYFYFTLCTVGVRVPKIVSMTITSLQIVQMTVGVYVSTRAFGVWLRGEACLINGDTIFMTATLYAMYLGLFTKFFVDAYLQRDRKLKEKNKDA